MSIFNNNILAGAAAQSTTTPVHTINQSIRFNDGDSPILKKTYGSAGTEETFTFSCWVKRGAIGAGLGGALGSLIPIPGVGTFLGGWAGDWVGGTLYDWITKSKESKEVKEEGASEAEGMNSGGTVTGRNVGNRDTVPTLLTVGEKVVPREQVNQVSSVLL